MWRCEIVYDQEEVNVCVVGKSRGCVVTCSTPVFVRPYID